MIKKNLTKTFEISKDFSVVSLYITLSLSLASPQFLPLTQSKVVIFNQLNRKVSCKIATFCKYLKKRANQYNEFFKKTSKRQSDRRRSIFARPWGALYKYFWGMSVREMCQLGIILELLLSATKICPILTEILKFFPKTCLERRRTCDNIFPALLLDSTLNFSDCLQLCKTNSTFSLKRNFSHCSMFKSPILSAKEI